MSRANLPQSDVVVANIIKSGSIQPSRSSPKHRDVCSAEEEKISNHNNKINKAPGGDSQNEDGDSESNSNNLVQTLARYLTARTKQSLATTRSSLAGYYSTARRQSSRHNSTGSVYPKLAFLYNPRISEDSDDTKALMLAGTNRLPPGSPASRMTQSSLRTFTSGSAQTHNASYTLNFVRSSTSSFKSRQSLATTRSSLASYYSTARRQSFAIAHSSLANNVTASNDPAEAFTYPPRPINKFVIKGGSWAHQKDWPELKNLIKAIEKRVLQRNETSPLFNRP